MAVTIKEIMSMKNIKLFGLVLFSSITMLQAADLAKKSALESMNSKAAATNMNTQAGASSGTYAGWADKIKSAFKYVVTQGPELHDESELQDPRTPDQQYPEFIKNLEKCMAKALNNIKEMFKTLQIVKNKKNVMLQKMREFDQKVKILNESIQNSQMTVYEKQGYLFAVQRLLKLFNDLSYKVNQKILSFEALEIDFENQIVNNPCMIFNGTIINGKLIAMNELVKRFMNELNEYNNFFDFVVSADYKTFVAAYNDLSGDVYKATVPFAERWARATFTSPAAF